MWLWAWAKFAAFSMSKHLIHGSTFGPLLPGHWLPEPPFSREEWQEWGWLPSLSCPDFPTHPPATRPTCAWCFPVSFLAHLKNRHNQRVRHEHSHLTILHLFFIKAFSEYEGILYSRRKLFKSTVLWVDLSNILKVLI